MSDPDAAADAALLAAVLDSDIDAVLSALSGRRSPHTASGDTAITLAIVRGCSALARDLVTRVPDLAEVPCTDAPRRGATPLYLAALAGDAPLVACLAAAAHTPATGPSLPAELPLHAAVVAGSRPAVAELLHAGADPNALDTQNRTALHHAAAAGHPELVADLVDAGADPLPARGALPLAACKDPDVLCRLLALPCYSTCLGVYGAREERQYHTRPLGDAVDAALASMDPALLAAPPVAAFCDHLWASAGAAALREYAALQAVIYVLGLFTSPAVALLALLALHVALDIRPRLAKLMLARALPVMSQQIPLGYALLAAVILPQLLVTHLVLHAAVSALMLAALGFESSWLSHPLLQTGNLYVLGGAVLPADGPVRLWHRRLSAPTRKPVPTPTPTEPSAPAPTSAPAPAPAPQKPPAAQPAATPPPTATPPAPAATTPIPSTPTPTPTTPPPEMHISLTDLQFPADDAIGAGHFGEVFLAKYLGLDVAVKRLKWVSGTEEARYVEREIEILRGIRHPHLIQIVGLFQHGDHVFLVTDYVPGGNLRQLLQSDHELSWPQRVSMCMDIARAVAYLHSRNIIHRDLKSENLLVQDYTSLKIKVCDFGFARRHTKEKREVMTLCGTPDFAAPEILLGLEYDEKVDVFSYGVVLVEVITRHYPGSPELGRRRPQSGFGIDFGNLRSLTPASCPPRLLKLAISCCNIGAELRPSIKAVMSVLDKLASPGTAPRSPPIPRRVVGGAGGGNTLAATVSRALQPEGLDTELTHDLLLSYRLFTTADALYEALAGQLAALRAREGSDDNAMLLQLQVLDMLRMWIDQFTLDFVKCEHLLAAFEDVLESLSSSGSAGLQRVAFILKNLIGARRAQLTAFRSQGSDAAADELRPQSRHMQVMSGAGTRKVAIGPVPLLQQTASDVAKGLTLIVADLFVSVHALELLAKPQADAEQIPSLHAIEGYCDKVARWAATTLLRGIESPKECNQKAVRLVEIAAECMRLNNFLTPFDIVRGITQMAAAGDARVAKLVKGLPRKCTVQLKQLEAIADDNYVGLRKMYARATPPAVPPLFVQLKDIRSACVAVSGSSTKDNVHLERCHDLAGLIRAFRDAQANAVFAAGAADDVLLELQLHHLEGTLAPKFIAQMSGAVGDGRSGSFSM